MGRGVYKPWGCTLTFLHAMHLSQKLCTNLRMWGQKKCSCNVSKEENPGHFVFEKESFESVWDLLHLILRCFDLKLVPYIPYCVGKVKQKCNMKAIGP